MKTTLPPLRVGILKPGGDHGESLEDLKSWDRRRAVALMHKAGQTTTENVELVRILYEPVPVGDHRGALLVMGYMYVDESGGVRKPPLPINGTAWELYRNIAMYNGVRRERVNPIFGVALVMPRGWEE